MPAFSEGSLTPRTFDTLAAYLADPVAGERPPERRNPRPERPPLPPPPEGQTRYYGPFGNTMMTENGLVAIGPPFSSLVAYDLNAGEIKWRVPLGTTPGLAAKGITNTGSSRFPRNGPVTTAGGLIFLATGPDQTLRAYDKATGKVLWEHPLPANPDGIPAVYQVKGRQYVAFYAAGNGNKDTMAVKGSKPEAQGYYVFALPGAGR